MTSATCFPGPQLQRWPCRLAQAPKQGRRCLRFATAQNLTQLSHLSELRLEAARLGGHGSRSEGMRAPSQEGQHFTCQAPGWEALLHCIHGDSHPVTGKWGDLSQNANRMNSPGILRKASIAATVSKGVGGSTQGKCDLLGALGALPAPQTRALGWPAGFAWVPTTQARPARRTHQVKSLPRILLSWRPILPTVPSAWGSLAPALAGDSASMGYLRASRARNPEKCSGPEDRRRCL